MTSSKYGNVLTIILIISIVAVLTGAGILVYNYIIKPSIEKKQIEDIIRDFDEQVGDNNGNDNPEEGTMEATGDLQNRNSNVKPKPVTANGFAMIGYITIPKTNSTNVILDVLTNESLNTGVVAIYPSAPSLNEPGNVVIIGHNYKNGKFFSNNKKLAVGDKFQIKDNQGRTVTYTIYDKFEALSEDTSFYNRDTKGVPEVTLSSCVDETGSPYRIIILAIAL